MADNQRPNASIKWIALFSFLFMLIASGCNSGGSGGTPAASSPPASPDGLEAVADSPGSITLSWNDNSDNETGFIIEWSPDASSYSRLHTTISDTTTYTNTGLRPGTTYHYRLRAYNSTGYSDYTEPVESTTLASSSLPDPPSGLMISSAMPGMIQLSWDDNSANETGFIIERSTDGSSYSPIHTTDFDVTTYSDANLNPETTYYYRLRAVNNHGHSDYTAPVHATTLPVPAEDVVWDPDDFSYLYDVGPGRTYADPSEVPWESVQASSLVQIHWRPEPYRAKWLVTTQASAENPVVITGVPDNGRLPVITGDNAVTRTDLYYLNQPRSVLKIGNYTGSGDQDSPAHVYIEKLDIRSGRPGFSYTNTGGNTEIYSNNAAAVHIEEGSHITIRGCILRDSGNGLFSTHLSDNILISGNYIYDNGIEGSYYEHNTYTESFGITYEYNYFGPLRSGCTGNNLKDRSAGTVIRYNRLEAGNRQLDLVDSGYESFYNDPSYEKTFVYGNIISEPDGAGNSQIIHYGGDSGENEQYRKGVLYFYHNTVISTRSGNTTLVNLSTDDVTADIRNNLIYTTASPGHLALTSGRGIGSESK